LIKIEFDFLIEIKFDFLIEIKFDFDSRCSTGFMHKVLSSVITLQRMKEVILKKLYRTVEEMIMTMHFRYLTRLGGGVSYYTIIEIAEDDVV